jgi:hypothetical protein
VRRQIAVLAATTLAACGDGPPFPKPTPPGQKAGGACTSAAQCAPGLVCFQNLCAASLPAASSCAPPGEPRVVLGDPVLVPEPPPDLCVAPVREPVLDGGHVQDLGEHRVGTRVPFQIPRGTSSFTISSQSVQGPAAAEEIVVSGFRLPNSVVPTEVLLPDGGLFFDDLAPYPEDGAYEDVTGLLAYYGGATPIAGTFTSPNTSASLDLARSGGQVPPGTWSFTVNDWARECIDYPGCTGGSLDGRYRVHVLTRPGPLASTGTLDLEVYVATDPEGRLRDAAAAVADPQIPRWVRTLSRVFANAGICLGTITFRELPGWARARYSPNGVVDVSGGGMGLSAGEVPLGCDDLSQLFTVAVAPSRAIHVFLAEELFDGSSPGLGTTLGVDGSIPGPSGVPGTVNGGAVVGFFGSLGAESLPRACSSDRPNFACGSDVLAYVTAHEAGHWLGLYHTTEWDGTRFDPLADTPPCRCLACVPLQQRGACAERSRSGATPVSASSCTATDQPLCGGAQNLMFWQFDPSRAEGRLSPEQGEVMRLNPAVH